MSLHAELRAAARAAGSNSRGRLEAQAGRALPASSRCARLTAPATVWPQAPGARAAAFGEGPATPAVAPAHLPGPRPARASSCLRPRPAACVRRAQRQRRQQRASANCGAHRWARTVRRKLGRRAAGRRRRAHEEHVRPPLAGKEAVRRVRRPPNMPPQREASVVPWRALRSRCKRCNQAPGRLGRCNHANATSKELPGPAMVATFRPAKAEPRSRCNRAQVEVRPRRRKRSNRARAAARTAQRKRCCPNQWRRYNGKPDNLG
mmetsp:Transcript_52827/g.153937  ORF Transcript_52827/g.153937 Transcript_52827/m.153937 type:complete len:263 (-) Transcript_52827:486-1274(-)